MVAPPRFDCDLARKMLPEGSSFHNPRLNLPVMLAQSESSCLIIATRIIAAHSAVSESWLMD
jgi:hypothetical protein